MLNFRRTIVITVVLLLVFVVLIYQDVISLWWFLGLFLIFFTLVNIGSFHIRWDFFLKAKHHNYSINENKIALTFDDGPHPEFTPKVLDLLKKHSAKATFFCIGKNIEKYPEVVKRILAEGHLIGNHSYSHSNNYGFLSTKKIIEDLEKTQRLLQGITGEENKFFRPPFGVTNPNIAKAIKTLNLQTYGWSIRSLDTIAKEPTKVLKKIKKKFRKGAVILLHDTSILSCDVLEQLLQFMERRNIKSVTVSKLFNAEKNEY